MVKTVSQAVREVCLGLPEAEEVPSRGSPDFRVHGKTFATYVINHHGDGKKTYLWAHYNAKGKFGLQFWVGAHAQDILTDDPRFTIPAYTGHNGWINLDVEQDADWSEIQSLTIASYHHFALKRMLKALEET